MTASKTETPANAPAETTPGWDLLTPLDQIPAWDLMDLYADLSDLMDAHDSAETLKDSLRIAANLARAVKNIAVDAKAYESFATGPDGFTNVMNLTVAWVGELGKSFNSAI